jgi:hypothetical protein
MGAVSRMAGGATETPVSRADLGALRIPLVVPAGGGLLGSRATTTPSVYQPWGRTRLTK